MKIATSPLAGLGLAAALLTAPSLVSAQTVQGLIVSHQGQTIGISSGGTNTMVTLTPDTKIQSIAGVLGGQRQDRPDSDLIAGLAVNVDTTQNGSELDAVKITFKVNDYKTAMAAQAAMAPEKAKLQVAREKLIAAQAENERRLSLVGQFEQAAVTRVYFATGSSTISAQGKEDLKAIAAQGMATNGGLFRIVGHTDSTGSAAVNQRLSDQRASAVTAYLFNSCGVPSNKIMGSTGLGQDAPMDSGDMGSAKNRRVAVFVMVSKASLGTSSLPPAQPAPQ